MIDEFKRAGVDPRDVWPQSFNLDDVLYWIRNEPRFGRQAVYLDDVDPGANIPPLTAEELHQVRAQGVRILAPPVPALLTVNELDEIVPSQYALDIRRAGLKGHHLVIRALRPAQRGRSGRLLLGLRPAEQGGEKGQ
jgi:glycerophosphoryl diester phosphodiesterase